MDYHGVTKNLSQKNLNSIYTLISERLKKHNRAYKTHITRKDKISIMQNAEKLVHTAGSNFSREDKKDLEKIVDSLKQQNKKNIIKEGNNQVKINENLYLPKKQSINSNNSNDFHLETTNNANVLIKEENSAEDADNIKNARWKQNNSTIKNSKKIIENKYHPPKIDKEIEDLRKQAHDLVI